MMDEMDWWVRWSTASKGSKSLVPDLLRQAPSLVFRAGRAGDEARAVGCGLVEGLKAPSRGAAGERGAAGLVGAKLSSVSRGQRDGDSGQSVSEVSGSARRSSAGNGGKRVPHGAGGLLETKLEWTGRVVSWSTGVYLRRAGRHCDAARTAPVQHRYRPLPALLCRYVPALAARACEQLIVCQAVAGTWAWCLHGVL